MNDLKEKITVFRDGSKTEWRSNGKLHRLDGPAIKYSNGLEYWYLNGRYHRDDGPAITWVNGYKAWFVNGKLHRVDGPAIEYAEGDYNWYLNDVRRTFKEWLIESGTTLSSLQIETYSSYEVSTDIKEWISSKDLCRKTLFNSKYI